MSKKVFNGDENDVAEFQSRLDALDTVKGTELQDHDDGTYLKIYPAHDFITDEISRELGKAGVSATPDRDGLLVPIEVGEQEDIFVLKFTESQFFRFINSLGDEIEVDYHE